MCEKCVEIDTRIRSYRHIRLQIPDEKTREAIAGMIDELQQKRRDLHSEVPSA